MVILYTTHCPRCKVLEKKLKEKKIKYKTEEDAELMIQKGFSSIPMLECDGKAMEFIEAIRWINTQR